MLQSISFPFQHLAAKDVCN